MKICVIGGGYVGLVSGGILADLGHHVFCYEKDQKKLNQLQKSEVPIYEPGLEEIIKNNINERLFFTNDLKLATQNSEIALLAVGTPCNENGYVDLNQVKNVIKELSEIKADVKHLVIKSSIPPTSNKKIRSFLKENGMSSTELIINPEFLREGHAIHDFRYPKKIVIGVASNDGKNVINRMYKPILDQSPDTEIFFTDNTTAEMIKYATNCFLAVKVAYMNDMSRMCDASGANIEDLILALKMDNRIGPEYLRPGPGYGGSCLPKDTSAFIKNSKDLGIEQYVIEAAIKSNQMHIEYVAEKILSVSKNSKVGVFGISFKANTDDIRYSPSVEIIKILLQNGVDVFAFDPKGMENAALELPDLVVTNDLIQIAKDASALVILTEWDEFKNYDFDSFASYMKKPILMDFRNLLINTHFNKIQYFSLGKFEEKHILEKSYIL